MLSVRDLTESLPSRVTRHSQSIVHHLFHVLAHLGGFGLLILSFVDSSPVFIPFGNDLLMIAMAARRHDLVVYYALMSAVGSVLGCLTVDALSRKGGEKGLERHLSRKRLDYVKKRIKKNAAWALVIASLLPPPFPFTGFVAGAAALQYPRNRLLSAVFVSRFARFLIEGALGIFIGRRIFGLVRSPVVIYSVVALIVISIAGTALVIVSWVKRSGMVGAAGTA